MNSYYIFLIVMAAIAVIVFVALFFVKAGYGLFTTKQWGLAINNKIAWCLMESPVFLVMFILWALAPTDHKTITTLCCLLIFETHYFQRSFIFPFLLKGNSKMPLSVMFMGATFNTLNALMQGGWLFYFSPTHMYTPNWLITPQFICGTVIFFIGMYINIDSDRRIRNLRKPGDTKHYMPTGGMYNYVSSANYFGEFIEWVGFAILTWSWSGAVFAIWTFANLAPRANAINKKYAEMFGEEFTSRKVKRMIPFIY